MLDNKKGGEDRNDKIIEEYLMWEIITFSWILMLYKMTHQKRAGNDNA